MRHIGMLLLGLLLLLTVPAFAMEFEYEDTEFHVRAGGVADNTIIRSGSGSVSVPVGIAVADTVLSEEGSVPRGVTTSASSSFYCVSIFGIIAFLSLMGFVWAYRELNSIYRKAQE